MSYIQKFTNYSKAAKTDGVATVNWPSGNPEGTWENVVLQDL